MPGKVAEYLALNGETHKYKISKDLKLHPSRVSEGLKRLEKLRLVKDREIGKARTGLIMRGYSLTVEGIATVLLHQPKLWEKIDIIADKSKETLPLIFGKWDYFKHTKTRESAIKNLKDAFWSLAFSIDFSDTTPRKRPLTEQENVKIIYDMIIWPPLLFMWEDLDKSAVLAWKSTIVADPDLNAFAQQKLAEREKAGLNRMKADKLDRILLERKKEVKSK